MKVKSPDTEQNLFDNQTDVPSSAHQSGRQMTGSFNTLNGVSQKTTPNAQRVGMQNQRIRGTREGQNVANQRVISAQQINNTGRVRNQMLDSQGTNQSVVNSTQNKKKSPIIPIMIVIVIVVLIIAGVFVVKNVLGKNKTQEVVSTSYEKTGRYVYDLFQNALIDYNQEEIRNLSEDSYIAMEWDYVNNNSTRQMFVNSICSYIDFEYPSTEAVDVNGKVVKDSDGNIVNVESDMLNGEKITVTVVDYTKLSATMEEDKELIQKMYKKSKISTDDYIYQYKMTDLMLEYILSKGVLPTKKVEVYLPLVTSADGYKIADDSELDDILFGSEEFHSMCDTYAKVVTDWTGKKMETYMADDWVENPEYTKWRDELVQRMEADGGKFTKKSTWEPWYLRDEDNKYVLDENGEKIVNYYTIKDENGNDVMQPDEKIMGKVEKEREVDDPFKPEQVIPYIWCGANFILNEYDGDSYAVMQVGDGTFDRPAGVGTEIVTVVLGNDGLYHDVKITLMGYWTGQDAIAYSIGFSEKNRGFDNSSVVKLITYEVKVENLEDKDIIISSEMFLSDETSNQSSRTGTMYGFYSEDVVIPAGRSVTINDWATSTELEQKYVCWGKSFGRVFNTVWFKVLAGNGGVVETYDATASTINKSSLPQED